MIFVEAFISVYFKYIYRIICFFFLLLFMNQSNKTLNNKIIDNLADLASKFISVTLILISYYSSKAKDESQLKKYKSLSIEMIRNYFNNDEEKLRYITKLARGKHIIVITDETEIDKLKFTF